MLNLRPNRSAVLVGGTHRQREVRTRKAICNGGDLSDLCHLCGFCHLQPAEDVPENVSPRQDASPRGDVQGIQRKLSIRPDNGAELLDESGVGNDVSFR